MKPNIAWPIPAIGWWYVPDENWPLMMEQISSHPSVVTSIMMQTGVYVALNGTIMGDVNEYAQILSKQLPFHGVRAEFWLTSQNYSIDSYRLLWADNVTSIARLVDLAIAYNISGWNIDLETDQSTDSDAVAYAAWLATLKSALHHIGVRLTIDVSPWTPMMGDFSVLAPSVDRMMHMETYNGDSLAQWLGYYNGFISSMLNRDVAGVGLGCWVDSSTNGTWAVTPESATERIAQIKLDNVPEIDMFRLLPVTGSQLRR
jgi:hypothetical protein